MAGTARLEFAVSVAVLGVVGAFALGHIAELQAVQQHQGIAVSDDAIARCAAILASLACMD